MLPNTWCPFAEKNSPFNPKNVSQMLPNTWCPEFWRNNKSNETMDRKYFSLLSTTSEAFEQDLSVGSCALSIPL